MLARLHEAIAELGRAPASLPTEAVAESRAFLQWLADDHFTLLGYRQHDLVDRARATTRCGSSPAAASACCAKARRSDASASFAALPPQARALARAALPVLVVTKANTRSTVHRPGYTDYVGVKRYNERGEVVGEHRFLGLFTSIAYSARVSETPLLRGKVEAIAERAGLPPGGHLAKALDHILETYPARRAVPDLRRRAATTPRSASCALGDRQRLRLFVRRDPFERFVSCLVYVPREAYSTDLRMKFQRILHARRSTAPAPTSTCSSATRCWRASTSRCAPRRARCRRSTRKDLEARLAAAARRWDDELRDALIEAEGEARGIELFKRWATPFPPAYRERVAARAAVPDMRRSRRCRKTRRWRWRCTGRSRRAPGVLRFKVYRLGEPVVLSDSLPMLEHMGLRVLDERTHRVEPRETAADRMHDFGCRLQVAERRRGRGAGAPVRGRVRPRLPRRGRERRLQPPGAARAASPPTRSWCCAPTRSTCSRSASRCRRASSRRRSAAHPRIARMLVELFKLRFDPAGARRAGRAAQVNAHRAGAREGRATCPRTACCANSWR